MEQMLIGLAAAFAVTALCTDVETWCVTES